MPLLSELGAQDTGRKCLVLDLDETLVHSSFKAIQNADFIVPVEIEGTTHSVFVIKRPGVDEFMRKMGEIYEVVVFTASLSKVSTVADNLLEPDASLISILTKVWKTYKINSESQDTVSFR